MNTEGKPLLEVKQEDDRQTVTMPLVDVPMWVHKKLMNYQLVIGGERKQKFTLVQAYIEFLKAKVVDIPD